MADGNSPTFYSENDYQRFSGSPALEQDPQEGDGRSCFRRDLGRLLHSPSFRRLQGKTQLFPISENDFFRNRLTHSLEVAQIAKAIALKINSDLKQQDVEFFIDTDLVEFAGLAHDLGHPPFGHNGEAVLDELMRDGYGGFEGNAQTFRILTTLEKKVQVKEKRYGLDLTYRSLASILKYDKPILIERKEGPPEKGYYDEDEERVSCIKDKVGKNEPFKTLECQIMDLADDIAYSTYDLEDAFKAGFLSPMKMLSSKQPILEKVAEKTRKDIGDKGFCADDVTLELLSIFMIKPDKGLLDQVGIIFSQEIDENSKGQKEEDREEIRGLLLAREYYKLSHQLCVSSHERTQFTSRMVNRAIQSVQWEYNEKHPAFSKVFFEPQTQRTISVLKHLVYETIINSPRLQVAEARGKEIIREIFEKLTQSNGEKYLPEDYKELFASQGDDPAGRKRTICDFIASMTDRYALEYHRRLFGSESVTLYKDL